MLEASALGVSCKNRGESCLSTSIILSITTTTSQRHQHRKFATEL